MSKQIGRKFLGKKAVGLVVAAVLLLGLVATASAYEALVGAAGVLRYDKGGCYNGYTLFSPNSDKNSYLIDMEGNIAHVWETRYYPGLYAELLPNGNLLRAARDRNPPCAISGVGGLIQELDWDGKAVWEYTMNDDDHIQHHAFDRMPNGNTLILGWERISKEDFLAKGRKPGTFPEVVEFKKVDHDAFWPDFVREVNPAGETVWEFRVWDRVGTGPKQFDVNYILPMPVGEIYATFDWSHWNSVRYVPERDQILCSGRNFGEVYLIDHKTGELVWRWGNPTAYGQGKNPGWYDDGDQILFGNHDATWVGDGNVLIFDNGSERPEIDRSRAVMVNCDTNEIVWEYRAWDSNSFSSHRQGSCQLLPNNNVLITSSNPGHIFEVDKKGYVVWDFVNPRIMGKEHCVIADDDKKVQIQDYEFYFNMVHRAFRYAADFPGLKGKEFEKGDYIAGDDCPKFFEVFGQD